MPRPRTKDTLGQHFTPRQVAALMLSMCAADRSQPVLEPSSGAGVFLDLLAEAGFTDVEAVEVDARLAHHPSARVREQSFLTFRTSKRYALVIGNPPYIRWRDLPEAARQEMRDHPLFGELFNSLSDYLTAFIAGSVDLLTDGGELVFITPGYWLQTLHSQPLREWLLQRGAVTDVVDFGEAAVFPGVSSAIVVVRFVRGDRRPAAIRHHRYRGPRRLPSVDMSLSDEHLFERREIPPFTAGRRWTLATAAELVPVEALEAACRAPGSSEGHRRLGEYVRIANGMVSGLDRAFRLPARVADSLPEAERDAVLPVTKARQLTAYACDATTPYAFLPVGLTADEAHDRYPTLMRHLAGFSDELAHRYSYGRDLPFWEWAFPRSRDFLLDGTAKGLVPCKERLTTRPLIRVAVGAPGAVAVQDVTAFAPLPGTRESVEYVVAYLNHPWVTEWVRRRGLLKGGVAEFSEKPLSDIPFRPIDWTDATEVSRHDRVTALVRRLAGNDADPAATHAEIGALIAGLVGDPA